MQYFGLIRPFHRWGSSRIGALSGFLLVSGFLGLVLDRLVAADFNGDGKLDLAGNGRALLLGQGDGTFRAGEPFFTSIGCKNLAVADFNGDGKVDLATSDENAAVAILLGNGHAEFKQPQDFALPPTYSADWIATGDFNGDGYPDLAVAANPMVAILLNNGHGSFGPAVNYAPGGTEAFQLAVGDFRGDGKLDLVVAGSTLSILLGNGDGTFQPAVNYGVAPNAVAVADFNGDGKLDVAALDGSANQGQLVVLPGNGDGSFQAPVYYNFPTGASGLFLATADLNGDGHADVVAAASSQESVYSIVVFLGKGDGTFQLPSSYTLPVDFTPGPIAIGDLNGDGVPDVAIAGTYKIGIMFGNGDGTFKPLTTIDVVYADYIALGDFNHDGKLDLVVSQPSWDSVYFLLGNGDGTFQYPLGFVAAPSVLNGGLAVADFNRDGKPDVAVGTLNSVGVLLNRTR